MPPRRGAYQAALPADAKRGVNTLLHTLRGEQFRHQRNQKRVSAIAYTTATGPSLPFSQIFDVAPSSAGSTNPPATFDAVAGPVPRSWMPETSPAEPAYDTPEWRADALSLFFTYAPLLPTKSDPDAASSSTRVTPLTQHCLHALVDYYGTEPDTVAALRPYLHLHLRRKFLRYTAVHAPLGTRGLCALFDPEGHVDGEVILIGPRAVLRGDILRRDLSENKTAAGEGREWDAPEAEAANTEPLRALALVRMPLTVPNLLAFPPSLTYLALVNIPTPVPVHHLPEKCPLLELLDLSFNAWLSAPAWGEHDALARVQWRRWGSLRVLGCRGCGVDGRALGGRINRGRWVDVEVVS
ncbi:hypothetical protein OF83DRAFT_908946 [Amylostereum chailletii]|nr:hypothetical protein OF83DRAFT_908946 [Amylostereum chailletii]